MKPVAFEFLILFLIFLIPMLINGQGSPVTIWTENAHLNTIRAVAWADDASQVISGSNYSESSAKTWNAVNPQLIEEFPDHSNGVLSVDISPDNSLLAVGYTETDYASFGLTRLYDLNSGTVLDTFSGSFLQFSPDGNFLASAGGGVTRYLYVHRIPDRQLIHEFYCGSGYVNDIDWSPDGKYIAVGTTHNNVLIWDLAGDSLLTTFEGHTDDVSAVAFSPDGKYLASGAGGWDSPGESTIKIWRMSDFAEVQSLDGHGDFVYDLEFSPKAPVLLSCGRDGVGEDANPKIKAWSFMDGQLIHFYDQDLSGGVTDLAYSPDGNSILYGLGNGTLVNAVPPEDALPSAVKNESSIAKSFSLEQNYPNPFNPATAINFSLDQKDITSLKIYDISGRLTDVIVNDVLEAGIHRYRWAPSKKTPSGIYFYQLKSGSQVQTKRMFLVR